MSVSIAGVRARAEGDATFVIACGDPGAGRTVHRAYKDLQALAKRDASARAAGSDAAAVDFPGGRLKSLLSRCPWNLRGEGWRDDMTKGLSLANQWLGSIGAPLLTQFCDETEYANERRRLALRLQSEKHARKMQQYLMSAENVGYVIREALKGSGENTVYIEPSCGDGRLVLALAEQGSVRHVVGCELDAVISDKATAAVASSAVAHKCRILSGNFLSTRSSDFVSGLMEEQKDSIERDIVVFGGPPYTLGGGDGSLVASGDAAADTGRDLPLQFISHAARELKPRKMVLLLPPRCGETSYIERTKETIINRGVVGDGISWDVVTVPAPNNEFDFCGRIIRQPSIIQLWTLLQGSDVVTDINSKKRKIHE